ncbi:MAG: PPC domain-containing protein [Myxococcales bacterium]|nr:PPC domain-containing protein [Myxococcales bacterium]
MRTPLALFAVVAIATAAAPAHAQRRGGGAAATRDARVAIGGGPVAGTLEASDPVEPGRGYADTYSLQVVGGQPIAVSVESDDFDTYLIVRQASGVVLGEDDDGGSGVNSRLILTPSVDETVQVVVTSFSPETLGAYRVAVEPFVVHPVSTRPVQLGTPVDANLDDSDGALRDRGYADAYTLDLRAGDALEVTMTSSDFDAYLMLVGPTGEAVAYDDDGMLSGTDARLRFVASSAGTYRIIATSYDPSGVGAYRIHAGLGFDSTQTAAPLPVGAVVDATLGAGDSAVDGTFQDRYAFEVAAGQLLTITMRSDAFDTYLSLLDPSGYAVAYDDDSGGNLDSRISFVATRGGTYTVLAHSYDGGSGPYTIQLDVGAPAPVARAPIVIGQTVQGHLDSDDATLINGAGHVDTFTFSGTAGDLLDFVLDCDGAGLTLIGPTGETVNVDGDPYAPTHTVGLPFTGEYLLTVASWQTDPVDYSLTVRVGAERPDVPTQSIQLGVPVTGRLQSGDDTTRGVFSDLYAFDLAEAGAVRIRMTPTDESGLDGVLELRSSDGMTVASNDDAVGLDPIIRTFLAAGSYTIVASEYESLEAGYELVIEPVELPPVVVSNIQVGERVAGRIDGTDAISATRNLAADFYRVELGAGVAVTAQMHSTEIDSYVIVVDENGVVVVENDDAPAGGSVDAAASFRTTASGLYTIIATGYDAREGAYELVVTEGMVDDANTGSDLK